MAAIKALPFGDGNLITGVSFVAGQGVQVQHRLGRPWRGYLPMNVAGGNAAFSRSVPNAATDGAFITITSSANCTADVWVY
jgi:hypothetical protein